MTDEPALIRAILERPAEDMPRLVYADWLDANAGTVECGACADGEWPGFHGTGSIADAFAIELAERRCIACHGTGRVSNGYAERAEFIRVQVEIAKLPETIITSSLCPICRKAAFWRRGVGFDHEKRCGHCNISWEPGETLTQNPKRRKRQRRERELLDSVREWMTIPDTFFPVRDADYFGRLDEHRFVVIRRGFVSSITLPWEMVTEDTLRDLFTRHPIEQVVVTGREPRFVSDSMGDGFTWSREWARSNERIHTIPDFLRNALPLDQCLPLPRSGYMRWSRVESAQSALNAAVLSWGRELAGLTPLVPVTV